MARLDDVEAFGETCPEAEEVIHFLKKQGFHLVLKIGSSRFPHDKHIPPLPAQYHFEDQHHTEVIYLAGKDYAEHPAPQLPTHASRWWLSGNDSCAYKLIAQALTAQWGLCWQHPAAQQEPETHEISITQRAS